MTPELKSVTVVAVLDEHPPLDHLGEYRDTPGPEDRTTDRAERGDMGRNEKRYFVSATPDYANENYERMERFARGELGSYGIRAEAKVIVNETVQTITSDTIWGIASDTPTARASNVAREQLDQLPEILDALGIDYSTPLEASWNHNAPWSGDIDSASTHPE